MLERVAYRYGWPFQVSWKFRFLQVLQKYSVPAFELGWGELTGFRVAYSSLVLRQWWEGRDLSGSS